MKKDSKNLFWLPFIQTKGYVPQNQHPDHTEGHLDVSIVNLQKGEAQRSIFGILGFFLITAFATNGEIGLGPPKKSASFATAISPIKTHTHTHETATRSVSYLGSSGSGELYTVLVDELETSIDVLNALDLHPAGGGQGGQ